MVECKIVNLVVTGSSPVISPDYRRVAQLARALVSKTRGGIR